MPGLQGDGVVAALGSPIKKSRLSLKFFHKKETKRALDFSENHTEEPNPVETEETTSCDQVVPAASPSPPVHCEGRESLVPFVGFNNLGNTCYLNSILQVLYHCPGFKDTIKTLYQLAKFRDEEREDRAKSEEVESPVDEPLPAHLELLGSFHSLISSVEQLQSSYLLDPEKFSDGELATQPRKLLNTLRELNPMYEGYLQHDAQEVLQCMLAYIQEACDTIRSEQKGQQEAQEPGEMGSSSSVPPADGAPEEEEEGAPEGLLSGKRKSDTEAGNAKKKPKPQSKATGSEEPEAQPTHFTRSKRKSSGDITVVGSGSGERKGEVEGERKEEEPGKEDANDAGELEEEENKSERGTKEAVKGKKRAKLGWLRPSGKQPSIFSKFRSMGRISSHVGRRAQGKAEDPNVVSQETQGQTEVVPEAQKMACELSECQQASKTEEQQSWDGLQRLFQGRLVLRTRCLECESFTERREDFQDISVPVQEDEACNTHPDSEVSPEPKPEQKTLRWAISQFASVERIVGQDKYFCETCHHYTEAERSLLFDKTPEVVTIHLKCFAANSSDIDPYAGLSKVNTPLQTPLKLSLEEWCARPSAPEQAHQYELFAVVMHSGVTISSGHYTTYIRMLDLHRVSVRPQPPEDERDHAEDEDPKKLPKQEDPSPDYDDGEVSFSLNGKAAATNVSKGKRSSEGVGLLGGQRSLANYELGASKPTNATNPDKTASTSTRSNGAALPNGGIKKEREAVSEVATGEERNQASFDLALRKLLDYEGKWMLFDDSEVKLVEEEDFLTACSPDTCSTSTPYLLFYRKASEPR